MHDLRRLMHPDALLNRLAYTNMPSSSGSGSSSDKQPAAMSGDSGAAVAGGWSVAGRWAVAGRHGTGVVPGVMMWLYAHQWLG